MVRRDRVAALAALLYATLQVALFLTHEPFRDEAQSWLWAKTLASPREFLVIPGEGHPPLWFWLLRGLSLLADFDTARLFSLGVAMLNGVLLARLLRDHLVVLCLLLLTNMLLQYWGYYFRPYSLILTGALVALLLDGSEKRVAATWVMALTCGLHFMSGFLFAFWLLYAGHRGVKLRDLLLPAMLALLFGVGAILSAGGNAQAGLDQRNYLLAMMDPLAWPFRQNGPAAIPAAAVAMGLLAAGLRRERFILLAMAAAMLGLVGFAALFYGVSRWHQPFLLSLVLMAFVVAGRGADWRFLPPLLVVHAVTGLLVAGGQLLQPQVAEKTLYGKIVADAGPGFVPESQLVAWPDFLLSATAAQQDIGYLSGTTGAILGPVDYRAFTAGASVFNESFATLPAPYWLVCTDCGQALAIATREGRRAVEIDARRNAVEEGLHAYRIEPRP